jgi:Cu(I)/Ag(I) efflux system protein CusF
MILQLPANAVDMDMSNMVMDSSSNTHSAAIEAIGVVDKIDEVEGVITISHEAIKSLDWPAMTMNFSVKDKRLLSKLGKGKKINFMFIHQAGKYVITDVM